MIRLYEAAIGLDEIDSLGHMSMLYYGTRAAKGAKALLAGLGVAPDERVAVVAQDCFNHYLKEQFAGARLAVKGGVSDVWEDGLSLYLELINVANGERAATFILKPQLIERATRAPLPFNADALKRAAQSLVDVPAHGLPRSLDLSPPRLDVSYAEIERRFGANNLFGGGPRVEDVRVPAEACDAFGWQDLDCAQDIMFVAFHAMAARQGRMMGPPIAAGPDGRRIGWAMLENRQVLVAAPRAGDPIRVLSAPVKLARKTQQMRRWTFNTETGALLAVIDGVSLALDLDARRATDIPDYMRGDLEAQLAGELA
jgi:acyl-CoA thioester hydrolase